MQRDSTCKKQIHVCVARCNTWRLNYDPITFYSTETPQTFSVNETWTWPSLTVLLHKFPPTVSKYSHIEGKHKNLNVSQNNTKHI